MIHGYGTRFWDDHHPGHGRLELGIDNGRLFICQGPDPKLLIADELLWTLVHHPEDIHPGARLEWQPFPACEPPETCCQSCPYGPMVNKRECFYGSKLVIETVQRTLIYIIGEYECELNAWWAHWPD